MSKQSDMDYYLEGISIFYDEKLKFLSTKDNFLRCKKCPTTKIFKEEYDEISLSCGGKDSSDCGLKISIKFPKYLHYEKDMNLLKNELEAGLNLEKINEYMDVSDNIKKEKQKRKQIEEKMKDITDKFYKINVQNKKKDIENFYRSRVEKTKRCREILKDINKFEERDKVIVRNEYISLIKKLNEEYIKIKGLVETFQPFFMVKKPEVSLLMKVESEKKKIKKKTKKKPTKETGPKFNKGDLVHWDTKDGIMSGFVKNEKEMGGMIKIINEKSKTFYVPKGNIILGDHEPEPEPEEKIKQEKQERLYFSNSKDNKWLSTYNTAEPFKYNDLEYPSIEHAFNAQKLDNDDPMSEEYRMALSTNVTDVITPSAAKKFGGKNSFKENKYNLRDDWDNIKLKIMEEIIREYYLSNIEYIDKLLKTNNKLLVYKEDKINDYWGVNKKNEGRNNLGNILMKLREEFRND